jgi:hypothetical protein
MEVIFGSGPLPFILAKAQPKPKSGYYWAHINKGLRVSQVYTFSLLGATLLFLPSTAPYFSLARCSLSFLPLGLPPSLSQLSLPGPARGVVRLTMAGRAALADARGPVVSSSPAWLLSRRPSRAPSPAVGASSFPDSSSGSRCALLPRRRRMLHPWLLRR